MENQKTIEKNFTLEGKGLQTGKAVKVFFYPAGENEGIIFSRVDLKGRPAVRISDLAEINTDRRSNIGFRGRQYVETVEHVLAALWGAEIDNIRIELNGPELPALDGSAIEFLEAIKKSGIRIENAPRRFLEIKEPMWVEEKESFLGAFPSSVFKISYKLAYPTPSIGEQFFSGIIDGNIFKNEIAPARTFCLKKEALLLRVAGYGKGANFNNTLIMDSSGAIRNTLRFKDEPVRHKVLDLIGDLYLLGTPLKARIIALRSGHKLNLNLVKKIKENLCQ